MAVLFKLVKAAKIDEKVFSNQCCTYLYRGMKFAGWLPPNGTKLRYLYLIWSSLVFTFSTIYLPIGYWLSIAHNLMNFSPGDFLVVLQLSIEATGVSIRSLIVLTLMKRLHQTRSLLNELDKQLQNDEDRKRIRKAVAQANFIFLSYAVLFMGYTLSLFISSVFTSRPPWMVYNPMFDWRQNMMNLWMQVFLEYIVVSIAVFTDILTDTYTLVYMVIFRAHVDVLKQHISNLRLDIQKTEEENYEQLVHCIKYHKLILKCCNLMRPVMSRTIFVQFLLIGIVLGLTMINLRYFVDIYTGFSSTVYFAALLTETFPFCYLCDLLIEDCEELCNKLAESHWLSAEPKYKSTLRIFLLQVQRPISFTAGDTFPISSNTNIKMAKFAFSVMTIVQQMNLAERFK